MKYQDDKLYTQMADGEWINLDEYIRRIVREELKKK
jgi:hypothetical protein